MTATGEVSNQKSFNQSIVTYSYRKHRIPTHVKFYIESKREREREKGLDISKHITPHAALHRDRLPVLVLDARGAAVTGPPGQRVLYPPVELRLRQLAGRVLGRGFRR